LEIFCIASSVLFYVSYGKEVDTHKMIQDCLLQRKTVIVPKVVADTQTLLLSVLYQWDDLEKGCYEILEPKASSIQKTSISSIDLIIVPGIVFDIKKNRIGHGKGYYDKLLFGNETIPTVGLAFECQIVDLINNEDHDVKLDMIITEERIIT
jgi:5-formyltetrahydrofolate cyclo-ligase